MSAEREILKFDQPLLLVGPADMDIGSLVDLQKKGFDVVAADGGANLLLENGIMPDAIIGDMDSFVFSEGSRSELPSRIIQIDEQNSTDFEKCLYSINAPLFLAFGFAGKRFDHTLATIHAMCKYHPAKKVFLVGPDDFSFIHRGDFTATVSSHQIFSVFPLMPIEFSRSEGLKFPLEKLTMEIGRQIGTSNQTIAEEVGVFPMPEHQNTPYLVSMPNAMLGQMLKHY